MKTQKVLAIDGGGIRGVIAAVWLAEIDKRLKVANKGGVKERFDLIAGTSTGSIIACGIAKGLSPQQLLDLYLEKRNEIFPGGADRLWSRMGRFFQQGPSAPKYDGKGLRNVLASAFGDVTLKDLSPATMVVSYDVQGRQAVFFKSFKKEHSDLPVWKVCVASSSAPTYFPGYPMHLEERDCVLVDGGVVANNPTACAVAEAQRLNREAGAPGQPLVVVSLGTGELTRPISAKSAKEWGALEWAMPIIDVLFDGSTKAVDYIARQEVGATYFRLQTTLKKGLDDMDDVTATNVNALIDTAKSYLENSEVSRTIDEIVASI